MYNLHTSKRTPPNRSAERTRLTEHGKPVQTCTFSPLYFRIQAKVNLGEGWGVGIKLIVMCVNWCLYIFSIVLNVVNVIILETL